MAGPTPDFWQNRFDTGQTGWDRGGAGPQLQAWLDAGELAPPARVAVPGCGRGWDVAALAARGFEVVGLDYTPAAVEHARALCAAQGMEAQIEQADVLQYQPGQAFDAIYEQTCLCALHPDHWTDYAAQLHRWLRPGGSLWALFFQVLRPEATASGLIEGPPYHIDINAARALFTERDWIWPKPPYAVVRHPSGSHELGLRLVRR